MSAPLREASATPALPLVTRAAMFTRLFGVQASWNYETLLGTGVGFCMEPALRLLSGGREGSEFRDALARETRYFNAHPYLASIAVGALVRVELERRPPAQIERFRAALCSPLGSVGDQLVWAGWLPLCSLIALLAFGLGASTAIVVAGFLLVYNAGHVALRVWGLRVGWRDGLRVAGALANPVLRRGPQRIAQAMMAVAGMALPLALSRVLWATGAAAPHPIEPTLLVLAGAVLGVVLVMLRGRVEGWRVAMGVLAVVALYSVVR